MIDQTSGQQPVAEDRPETTRNRPVFSPPTDIYETADALVVSMEMPGVEPDGVDVTLDKRVLTITGVGTSVEPEGFALSHAEYRVGDYERAFTLSENIDRDGIEAALRDGVLRLTLPKVKPAPAKTISVKAG
ncbi:MAG: Hsp20/alpha crystallin family protein [Rhodospirillales bacterium]|nr:MAG: Hsp20/alpha crystallin family protein [Rhodospirillales bacterium]